jgi:assimilatory nitrate reductase catalytic subunit
MGGREVGGLSNLLSAHRELGNPAHRAEMARFWGVPFVPPKPGKPAVDLFRALKSGEIKAVWIACTNPAQSMPDQGEIRAALEAAEFVVLQEAYGNTDTAQVRRPAAAGDVVGREGRHRHQLRAPHLARSRGRTGTRRGTPRLADRRRLRAPAGGKELGQPLDRATCSPTPRRSRSITEHRESTRGRDLDITGISYELLERGPQQWPYPEGASAAGSGFTKMAFSRRPAVAQNSLLSNTSRPPN